MQKAHTNFMTMIVTEAGETSIDFYLLL